MSEYAAVRTVTKIEANPMLVSRKAENRKLRVAAYCRVSTDDTDQRNSLENQMQHYTSKISENQNWTFAGIYSDEGITGTTDKRKNFLKLMKDCRNGKVDYIITKAISRFARNTVDSLHWTRKLRALGIGVYFEEQDLDSSKVENETLLGFFSVMAQSESESISENVKWGVRKRMKKGVYNVPFHMLGYRKEEKGDIVIVPEEAEIVRAIFQRYLDGDSISQLKPYLETNRIKTYKNQEIWTLSVIRTMLPNEKYVGDLLHQKTFRTDCISKNVKNNRGELPRYLVSNNHPAIIDRDTFNLVQAEIARRNNKRKKLDSAVTEQGKYSGKYALSELLICGCCGGAYRRTSKVKNGKTTYYWRCIGRIEHGKSYCKDSVGIEEQMLHRAICRGLSDMMENSQDVLHLIQSNLTYAVSGSRAALDAFAIEKQMGELKAEITNMVELSSKTEGDQSRYHEELKKMFDKMVVLRDQLKLARSQAEQSETVNAEVARIMNLLKDTDMNFTEYNDVTVRRLVDCIQVKGSDRIVITLKGGYQANELLCRD